MILPEEKQEGGKGNVKLVKSICIELKKTEKKKVKSVKPSDTKKHFIYNFES